MVWTVGILENGPHDSTLNDDGRLIRNYKRKYWLLTDSATVPTESAVVAALGIDPGSPYENDINATCRAIRNLKQLTTRPPWVAFTVDVEWSTDAAQPNDLDTDPATTRVQWGIRSLIEQQYINEDIDGEPILNSAGQPYDGGIPVNARIGIAVARRRVDAAGYNKATVMASSGKLNETTYLGAAPGTLQVDIASEERFEGAYHFWEEEYQFAYDPKGWQPKPLDAGFFQLKDGNLVPITVGDLNDPPTADRTKVPEPEPLNEGAVVPYSERPDGCDFVNVDYFAELEFADFGLT